MASPAYEANLITACHTFLSRLRHFGKPARIFYISDLDPGPEIDDGMLPIQLRDAKTDIQIELLRRLTKRALARHADEIEALRAEYEEIGRHMHEWQQRAEDVHQAVLHDMQANAPKNR